MNKKKKKNVTNIWPSTLPTLQAIDFYHGDWEDWGTRPSSWCGKSRCMVGWVTSIFHGDSKILQKMQSYTPTLIGLPARTFLLKLLKLADQPIENYCTDGSSDFYIMWAVSDYYEGASGYAYPVSVEEAADLWNQTVESCGYTVSTYVFID